MKLWEHPTRSLQSLQRFKAIISTMTIQQDSKDAQLNYRLNLRYYHSHCTRGNNLKTHLQITQEGDERQFSKHTKSRSEDENKDFKISTKVEMNSKGRDIVEKKISRFIEQGFL